MIADLDHPMFADDDKAREYLESIHWPKGPVCPHCGERERLTRLAGRAHRPGVVQCNNCREQFTVTVGTVMERSKVPLHKWVLAMHLLCASKKGMSAHQLHRMLGVSYPTAWFMAHRLRAGMVDKTTGGLGGDGKTVEADETYHGKTDEKVSEGTRGPANKRPIVGLVERGGKVRTFHVARADSETVKEILRQNASRKSRLMTDESRLYTQIGAEFNGHSMVNHSSGEYVNWDDPSIHTNTIEGYFSIFKRGMKGIYQHCSEKHLHRYLAEFDFRYNRRTVLGYTDRERTELLAAGLAGKRLTYRRADTTTNA